jgi:GTP pyrophosphokinase
LTEWQKEIKTPAEFAESLKKDVFRDRIFVLTPKGDVKDLPVESTPVDFAYAIHTEIGHRCVGAKVFNEIVPLDYKLKNGDVVEIIASPDLFKGPSRDWLSFVKTSAAKSKIRSWFRRRSYNENLSEGKKILEKELERLVNKNLKSLEEYRISNLLNQVPYKNFDDVLAAIGEGAISAISIIRKLFSLKELLPIQVTSKVEKGDVSVFVEGQKGILTKIALCCCPKPGDQIIGYVTKGKGVTVHQTKCRNIKRYSLKRQVKVSWQEEKKFLVPVEIVANDRIGLFRDIGAVASSYHINLIDLNSTLSPDRKIITLRITFQVSDLETLSAALDKIGKLNDVLEVKRL